MKLKTVIFFMTCISLLFTLKSNSQTFEEYWDNGNLKLTGEVIDGKRNGLWKSWYQDGTLQFEGKYKKNELVGECKYYCEHGYLEKTTFWNENKCYQIVDYFLSGDPYVYLNFKDGLSTSQYLECNNILNWCLESQLKINKNLENDDTLMHYVFVPMFPSNAELFKYESRSNQFKFFEDSMMIVEEMKNEYLVRFSKSLNMEFEYSTYNHLKNLTRTVKRYEDSIIVDIRNSYFKIPPYSLFESTVFYNDILNQRSKHDIKNYELQYCFDYYENHKLKSEYHFKAGVNEGISKFYSTKGKLLFKEKYHNGEIIKSTRK